MERKEYREEDYVGLINKDVVTESGDKIGKVDDIVIDKGTKEGVLKVSHGILKTNEVIPLSEVVRVDTDKVVVAGRRESESEAERGVELR